MRRIIPPRWRRNRNPVLFNLKLMIISAVISSAVILLYLQLPVFISKATGIPKEIVQEALENNAGGVLLFGDFDTRHSFAKGEITAFGAMPYDIEERLMNPPYYWTTEKVHRKGFFTGFSNLR